jgi:hypothetical protein
VTPDDTNLQNWLDGAGFAGLAIGVVAGLVLGTWIVTRCWRWAMREATKWMDEQRGGDDGAGS